MNTSSEDSGNTYSPPHDQTPQSEADLSELRKLLLGPLQAQLDKLRRRLDSPELRTKDVSAVLPEAIALRSTQDKKMEISLEPITAKGLRTSIQKDRQVLVDALFPIIGPAIRKAILTAIQGMVQTFNQLLEHSFSVQSFKWRFQALSTRKPFAEVVLLHTLVYQVEQIFLIHRDSGLVMQHAVAGAVGVQDPDLVSSMLTAIKDFVQDSFGAEEEETLDTLRVGERSIWIEQGRRTILAAVIRGNPPMDFQSVLRDALDEIQFRLAGDLADFNGDTTPFEGSRYILESCLQAQYKQKKRKRSFIPWLLLALMLLAVGFWIFQLYKEHRSWADYFSQLRQEPGIVITSIEQRSGKQYLRGLRDPLAPDPLQILQNRGLDPDKIAYQWDPYHSWHSTFALKRIRGILQPPTTIQFEFLDGVLQARGSALNGWLVETRKLVKAIPWIVRYDDGTVRNIDDIIQPPQTVSLEIIGDQLQATGSADHAWIVRSRQLIRSIAGISGLREDRLIDMDLAMLADIRNEIQQQIIFMRGNDSVLAAGHLYAVRNLMRQIGALDDTAQRLGKKVHIEIVGHADSLGAEEFNLEISRRRAEQLLALIDLGRLSATRLSTVGVGSKAPVKEESTADDRAYNRSVTLNVEVID